MPELRIETTLTEQEHELMTLMMGYATGMVIDRLDARLAPVCVRIINKLLMNCPEFRPYDETSFDSSKVNECMFPFKMMPRQ